MPIDNDKIGDAQKTTASNGAIAQRRADWAGAWPLLLIQAFAVAVLCICFVMGLSSNSMRKYFLPGQICYGVALIIRGLKSRSRLADTALPQTPQFVSAALLAAMGLSFVYEAVSVSKTSPPWVVGVVLLGALGFLVGALIVLRRAMRKTRA